MNKLFFYSVPLCLPTKNLPTYLQNSPTASPEYPPNTPHNTSETPQNTSKKMKRCVYMLYVLNMFLGLVKRIEANQHVDKLKRCVKILAKPTYLASSLQCRKIAWNPKSMFKSMGS